MCFPGTVGFVNSLHGNRESPFQLAAEPRDPAAQRLGALVHDPRHADNDQVRAPFPDQGFDLGPVGSLAAAVEGSERTGGSGDFLSHCNARTRIPEVKPQDNSMFGQGGWDVQACPAPPVNRLRSIPSFPAAASQRSSGGTSNRMCRSQGTVSHAFSASSCSNCPAPQPA